MYKISGFTIILVLLYISQSKKVTFSDINKKLKRAILASVIFSTFGFIKIYLLRNYFEFNELVFYSIMDIIIVISTIGIYRKSKISGAILVASVICSIYGDQSVNISMIKPIATFIIYLRTIIYFDIIWDGVIGILIFYQKHKNNSNYTQANQ